MGFPNDMNSKRQSVSGESIKWTPKAFTPTATGMAPYMNTIPMNNPERKNSIPINCSNLQIQSPGRDSLAGKSETSLSLDARIMDNKKNDMF